jgi:hypothetical protein
MNPLIIVKAVKSRGDVALFRSIWSQLINTRSP